MAEQELASIKKPNEANVYSSREEFENAILEIAKCKRDIVYFAEKYFRVINLDKGLHVIKLYDIQKEFLKFLTENNKVICVSGRQQGKSTIYCIYSLWLACFFPEKKIMMLANKLSTATELLSRIELAYQYLPKWIKPGCTEFNKMTIQFSNMSSIKAFASSSYAARGHSCNVLILDEFAFLQKNLADKLFTSMYPVVSSSKNGKVIIVSTPNGTGNLYYDIWQQANSKDPSKNLDGWKPFEMFWWQVPSHDEKWKAAQIAAIGAKRFAQEFNNEFLTSADTKKLIPDDVLENYRMKLSEYKLRGIKPMKQKIVSENEDEVYEFEMWHEFKQNHAYLASADISEGVGSDASVLYVWDVTSMTDITMCAKFSSNTVSLVQFAYVISKILALYGNPPLAAERNGVSAGTLDSLRITYGYPNVIVDNKKNEAGIYSHVQVKGKACLWARDMFTTRGIGFTIYDKALIDELNIFCKKDTKGVHLVYQALPGPDSHDDHVMAFIWACFILHQDRIDQHFMVCENFTTDLGQVLPKTLQPMNAYSSEMMKRISNDPLYKDFIDFKAEVGKKAGSYEKMMKKEDEDDMFKYKSYKTYDQYFGDSSGEDWSETALDWNMGGGDSQNGFDGEAFHGGHGMPFFSIS